MQLTLQLQQKLAQAVSVSMRIEGYQPGSSLQVQEKVRVLMEQQRVKVSVPAKRH